MNSSKKNNIYILGNGGFSDEVEWLIRRTNQWNIFGKINQEEEESLLHTKAKTYVALGIGQPSINYEITQKLGKNPNIIFPNIIDPSVISDKLCLGQGNIICAGNILTTNISIGSFNIINLNCTIGHGTIIDNYCVIAPGCNISGWNHIHDSVYMGSNATTREKIELGQNSIIGCGAVVVKNTLPNTTNVGIPAKPR